MTVFDRLEAQLTAAHPQRSRRALPRPAPRHVLAFAAAAAAVIAIVVAGLAGGSSAGSAPRLTQPGASVPPVVPGRTTVSVLNAAHTPGLARDTAVMLERHGWRIGVVTNYPGAPPDSSCVDFFPGHSLAATQIADQLGIGTVVPASDLLRKAAGQDAGVVVVVGSDRAR